MDLDRIKRLYFLGIGGIGQSALARYFVAHGVAVSGYDRNSSWIVVELQKLGIEVSFIDAESQLPEAVDLIVYTPAIPKDSPLFVAAQRSGIPMMKRAEVLAKIANEHRTIAVAGTHGKTSTSALSAHILANSQEGVLALVGGVMTNYKSNYIFVGNSDRVVVEADEFDRSFLHLKPFVSIITSVDADHLDIYGDAEALCQTFNQFAQNVLPEGTLLIHSSLRDKIAPPNCKQVLTYGLDGSADYSGQNLKIVNGHYQFDLVFPEGTISQVVLGALGRFNVENSIAAAAAAMIVGATSQEISEALFSFQGVKRRFERHIETDRLVMIDDYAHHPEELKACIRSVRELYPDHKITAVFQPHLFSRTASFASDFAKSLDEVDQLFLLDIYPAREQPIAGVTSKLIADKLSKVDVSLCSKEQVVSLVCDAHPELLLTVGAGDIDKLVNPLVEALKKRYRI